MESDDRMIIENGGIANLIRDVFKAPKMPEDLPNPLKYTMPYRDAHRWVEIHLGMAGTPPARHPSIPDLFACRAEWAPDGPVRDENYEKLTGTNAVVTVWYEKPGVVATIPPED